MPSVLFVCTGNIHRSPMAEYLFKKQVGQNPAWRIASAGTYTRNGLPTTSEVFTVMQPYGLDLRAHRSREVDRPMIESYNLVLCLASNHKEALQAEFPDLAGRIFLLSEMAGKTEDVADPIGGPLSEFETTARTIETYLNTGYPRILELAD